jgi:hypothetical protein
MLEKSGWVHRVLLWRLCGRDPGLLPIVLRDTPHPLPYSRLQDDAAIGALSRRMDSDGFTLVTRKKGGAAAASAALPGMAPPDESDNIKQKRKRGSLQKADFYSFQKQDAKIDRESCQRLDVPQCASCSGARRLNSV